MNVQILFLREKDFLHAKPDSPEAILLLENSGDAAETLEDEDE